MVDWSELVEAFRMSEGVPDRPWGEVRGKGLRGPDRLSLGERPSLFRSVEGVGGWIGCGRGDLGDGRGPLAARGEESSETCSIDWARTESASLWRPFCFVDAAVPGLAAARLWLGVAMAAMESHALGWAVQVRSGWSGSWSRHGCARR